jgi:hypothetical protein
MVAVSGGTDVDEISASGVDVEVAVGSETTLVGTGVDGSKIASSGGLK